MCRSRIAAMRNVSLYAILYPQGQVLYIGSTSNLRARFGRHAWELANGRHHCHELANAYRAAQQNGHTLHALGLDWGEDREQLRLMERILIATASTVLPTWKLANTDIPSESYFQDCSEDQILIAIERLTRLAIPSLRSAKPLLVGQIFGDLDLFISDTDNFRRTKRSST